MSLPPQPQILSLAAASPHSLAGTGIGYSASLPAGTMPASVKSCLLSLSDTPFDPAWFEEERIALPGSISRSVRRRQAEFFFGRWAAREALLQCGVTGHDVGVGASREPVWPPGWVGSLTHCDQYAAAVVASAQDLQCIGIDIERVATAQSLDALLSVAIDACELEHLARLTQTLSLAQLATLVFSAKESFYKAAFPEVRRFFGFEAARVVEVCPSTSSLRLKLTESLTGQWRVGVSVCVYFHWIADDAVFTCFWA